MLKKIKQKLNAFPYFGGKYYLLPILLAFIPVHITYCEVFGGAANFLLNKEPSKVEIYNDINSDIVNFFRTLRNKPVDLCKLLKLTPYGREEFYSARNYISFEKCSLEKARKFFVKAQQSFAGRGDSYGFGIERNSAGTFTRKSEKLIEVARRLKHVQIENKDYEFMIGHYLTSNKVFAYMDPPYLHETRTGDNDYEFEMADKDHLRMLKLIKKSKAKILLSGYYNKLYNEALKGWNKKSVNVALHSSLVKGEGKRPRRTEIFWYNYNL